MVVGARFALLLLLLLPLGAWAGEARDHLLDLTHHRVGLLAISVFVFAYALVMAEEFTDLRKSKPVVIAAGLIWVFIGAEYGRHDLGFLAEEAARHNLLDYAELMLFLLVAMTYINTMKERRVFEVLRIWLIRRGFGFRQLFWMTGLLTFFISPIADNLTTALLMCAVVLAVGGGNARFVGLACTNIVVAANAGGAFSPFGDITTLMVWLDGVLPFPTFFLLFVPALVNFLVPATIMHFTVPSMKPPPTDDCMCLKRGARRIVLLFLATITTSVAFHMCVGLPPVLGMLTGLGYLQVFGFYLKKTVHRDLVHPSSGGFATGNTNGRSNVALIGDVIPFDVFHGVARAEWDTLLFFYGVVMCVGGLGFIGYLELVSQLLYTDWGATQANITVGVLSAVVDNIPVMFAVLNMDPDMSTGQWLLVTLTTGVGGSLLSIGSAAGVALMGQARGYYTFFTHLKWTPVIALGYAAGVYCHFLVNAGQFA